MSVYPKPKPADSGKRERLSSPNSKSQQQQQLTSQVLKTRIETFNRNFNHTIENLLNFQIGDPEFDEINLQYEKGEPLAHNDLLMLINIKLSKLVEILQREENEVVVLEEQRESLNNIFVEKRAISTNLLEEARAQLQELTEKNLQLLHETQQGSNQSQSIEKELQAKEGAIWELNKNIQQLMTEFVQTRDRNDRVDNKLRRIREGKKAEEEELRGPRPGSPEYDEKMNRIWAVERNLKEQEEIQRVLEEENDHLRQQLKELAPHSVLSPDDKSPKEMNSLIDLEKYADMKPEEIHEEIENLRIQASKQQDIINRLEAKNKEDIDAISIQKARIEELRAQYVENMDRFYQVKKEREDSLTKCNKIEEEISSLLKSFNGFSTLLGKEVGVAVAGKFGSQSYRGFEAEPKEEKMRFSGDNFYYSGGYDRGAKNRNDSKEGSIPAPSRLNVRPSQGETKENFGL